MKEEGGFRRLAPLMIALIAIIMTVTLTMTYVTGALEGKFKHIFLPSQVFGVPEQMATHGYTPLFNDGRTVGWDGQFYFSIANDPFARRDTPEHLDYDAYRYQRIGLPLLAALVTKLAGQDWVSPKLYYLTSLGIIFLASWIGAAFLQKRGINGAWILMWSLSMGTQVTQLHGLPDAAADGLLIIALIGLLTERVWLYAIFMTWAALTRETYVLLPAIILCSGFLLDASNEGILDQFRITALRRRLSRNWHHFPAIIAVLGWQTFIMERFHTSASAQAKIIGILDWPLKYAAYYLLAPLNGARTLGTTAAMESAGILIYLLLLASACYCLIRSSRTILSNRRAAAGGNAEKLGIRIAFLLIAGVYFCFGNIVMMDNTGYWKAASIFLFVIPFLAALESKPISTWSGTLLLSSFVLFGASLLSHVNAAPFSNVGRIDYVSTEPACLKRYNARIEPVAFEFVRSSWWQWLRGQSQALVTVYLTNTGNEDFSPYPGSGSVNASYQWLDARNGNVVLDGFRTALPHKIAPQESLPITLRVIFPLQSGSYQLKISLVQEGCAWFHRANPDSSLEIGYTVH